MIPYLKKTNSSWTKIFGPSLILHLVSINIFLYQVIVLYVLNYDYHKQILIETNKKIITTIPFRKFFSANTFKTGCDGASVLKWFGFKGSNASAHAKCFVTTIMHVCLLQVSAGSAAMFSRNLILYKDCFCSDP